MDILQGIWQGILGNGAVLAILLMALVLILGLGNTIAKNYHKVAPNQVAIISGRQRKVKDAPAGDAVVQRRGYRVVTGGGFFLWPIFEKVDYMSLNVMTIPLEVTNAPDKMGAAVSVKAIANVKVLSEDSSLSLAIERFLGYPQDAIKALARENLESNLRAIVGTLTVEELIRDRAALQTSVMGEAHKDMAKLGLGVDLLSIQNVSDERGYIQALGQKRTAEVKRDAEIGAAEAARDTKTKVSEADQLGSIAAASAQQEISESNRQRDLVIAENKALVDAANARISVRAAIATAEEQGRLNQAEVNAEKIRVTAETELQTLAKRRREEELKATTIVEAEAGRTAVLIQADAEQQAAVKLGEAARVKMEKEGQGEQAKLTGQAAGRKAAAEAVLAEMEAQASGRKAGLMADADGVRANSLAQAEGDQAKLLAAAAGRRAMLMAEADGASAQAKAFKELDEAGRFLMILQASPTAIHAMGDALARVVSSAAAPMGAGLASIKEVRMIDMGGNGSQNGEALISQFATLPVETMFKLFEKVKAAGGGALLEQLIEKAGLSIAPAKE